MGTAYNTISPIKQAKSNQVFDTNQSQTYHNNNLQLV